MIFWNVERKNLIVPIKVIGACSSQFQLSGLAVIFELNCKVLGLNILILDFLKEKIL